MEQPRVRIQDIAQELGLSTATVSNVIHGKTQRVSDQTIRRVQQALEERQYVPSMAAILLAQNSSRIIGVFVNDHEKYEGHTLDDVFIASSLNHLSTEIEARGLFMMVKKAKHPEQVIQFASMWNMEGLVIIGFCDEDYMYLRNHMRIPFVVYDGFCANPERICNIIIDNRDGGRQVAELFRSLGHQRALCLSDNAMGVDLQRYQGFRDGFAPGQASLLQIPIHREQRLAFYRESIALFRQVTCVFAVSDYYAMELIQFLQSQGFQIPRDLSVAGFDDTPMCTMITPNLTTVQQDGGLRAKLAMEKLRQLRENTATETTVSLPVKLVCRESTGSPRT